MAGVREQKRQRTRLAIAAAGRKLFYTKSYLLTSVGDIVEEAGVSRATFYLHYKRKLDIVIDLQAVLRPRLIQQYEALAAIRDPTEADVAAWIESFLDLYRREKRIINIVGQVRIIDPDMSGSNPTPYPEFLAILGRTMPAFAQAGPGGEERRIAGQLLLFQLERFCHYLTFRHWDVDRAAAVSVMARNMYGFIQTAA